jgi:hypothetical protein
VAPSERTVAYPSRDRDSSFVKVTGYGLDDRVQFPTEAGIFSSPLHPDQQRGKPPSYPNFYPDFFFRGESGRSMKLNNHLHLVLSSRMRGALLPLAYTFISWYLIIRVDIRRCIQKYPNWADNEINNNNKHKHSLRSYTKSYGTKLTTLTHKIVIQLHLVAENCTICSSRSRRPVRKLLDTLTYLLFPHLFSSLTCIFLNYIGLTSIVPLLKRQLL